MTNKLTLIKKNGCPPCAILAANLDSEDVPYKTINISETPEAIEQYGITSVPVLLIEKDGETTRLHGLQPVRAIKEALL